MRVKKIHPAQSTSIHTLTHTDTHTIPQALILSQRWLILVILNAVYFFVYFHRTCTAVLAPYLMEAFSASATSLGGMSSAYFYPYALSQPLFGFLTDRWGGRKVVTVSTIIACGGSLLFGLAPTLLYAALGRALIGFGAGGVFVPAVRVLLLWFGPRAFAQMNTLLLAVGNLGAIVSSAPYAWLLQQITWRSSFFVVAALTLACALLSWIYIRNFPPNHHPPAVEERPSIPLTQGNRVSVMKNPFFWTMVALFFTYSGSFSTFQSLWAYPFLIDVFQYDKIQASNLLMMIALGAILGGPVLGYLADRTFAGSKRPMLSVVVLVQVINWACIVFLGKSLGAVSLGVIFFVMGMNLAGTLSLVWAITREMFPPERLGTVMGAINPAPFLGAAVFQPLTGYIMDQVGKSGGVFPFEAYRQAFFLCLISVFVAFLISLFLNRKRSFAL